LLKLDHIAVVAATLEDGCAWVRERLGVDVPAGGKHPLMGTHNHLMRLGDGEYFEIIAIDPEAPAPDRPRWFGLDEPPGKTDPVLHWIVATDDIESCLREALPESGEALTMTRGDLSWRISIAADGQLPMSGAFPSLIDWGTTPHPSARMTDLGCRLVSLTVRHPAPERISAFLATGMNDPRVRVEPADNAEIIAAFETPTGLRYLD